MARSRHFICIKSQVLAIARAVPRGKVTTFASIGAHLDVMPRHVAYILAQLAPHEQDETPWHRLVADDCVLHRPRADARGRTQRDLLVAEGLVIGECVRIAVFSVAGLLLTLSCGGAPAVRPAGS